MYLTLLPKSACIMEFTIYDWRLRIEGKEIELRHPESWCRREGEGVERAGIAQRKVSLLNKNTETKEEQISLLEESDRHLSFVFYSGILS